MLTVVSCGGSDDKKPDAGRDGPQGEVLTPVVGKITVAPALLDFQTVDVGASSTAQVVTVSVSNAAVAISPTITGAGFALTGNTCSASQAAGTTCTISVKFAPTTVGAANGTLTIGTASVSLGGTGNQPGVFTAPDRIDLGTLKLNATAAVTVQIAPQGTVAALTCTSSNAAELAPNAAATTCPATGPVSAACVYAFTFNATTAGVRTDTVTCSGGGKTTLTAVAATVVGPAVLAVSQSSALFTAVVGKTDTATITVSNNGGSATVAAPTATVSAGATDFAITSNECVVALAPLSTCKITVTFKPTAAGAKTGTLTVTDSVTTLPVTLTGTAVADRSVTITPNPSDFGSVAVGSTKATTFTMKNAGGTATGLVTLSGATDEFKIGSDQCTGTTLAATTGTCTFVVTFVPAGVAGARAVIINAADAQGVFATAKLSGNAADAPKGVILSVSPATLDFGTIGVGTTAGPKSLTITNTGDTASAVVSVVKNDSTSSVGGASQFTYTTTCTGALEAGDACQVVVTFAPTIQGSASATITVTDGTASTKASTVVGIALSKPGLSITCPSTGTAGAPYTFATGVVVGKTSASTTCTVKNDSASTQETGALTAAATGDFAVATTGNTCTASLAPGLSCTIAITFAPTVKGVRSGTVTVTGANGGAANVNLSGTGLGVVEIVEMTGTCPAGLTTSPATCTVQTAYDFAQVTVGQTASPSLTLQVSIRDNVGNLTVSTLPATGSFAYASTGALDDCSIYATTAANGTAASPVVCYKVVSFKPTSKDVFNGTVTVTGANGKTDSATMKGTGTGPLTISPSPVTFTDVPVGSSSVITVTIANGGVGPIKAASYTLTGANKDQFSVVYDTVTGGTFTALSGAPANKQFLGVRFIPTSTTAATATITVTGTLYDVAGTTAIGTETQSVILNGNGTTAAALTATVSNNGVFADTAAGAISAPLTITVTNGGGSPTSVALAALSGVGTNLDFSTTVDVQGSCISVPNGQLAAGANCTYLVWFTPVTSSAYPGRSGSVRIGSKLIVPFSGKATSALTISPAGTVAAPTDLTASAIAQYDVSPAPSVTFTVTNNTAADIPAAGLTIATAASTNGPNLTSLFQLTAGTCGAAVAKNGGTCTFTVSATALSAVQTSTPSGTFFGKVSVSVGAQKVMSELKATVGKVPLLQLTTATDVAPRDLGVIPVNAASAPVKFTLINVGGSPAKGITAAITDTTTIGGSASTKASPARWTVDASGCQTAAIVDGGLAPGQTCDILVTAHPTTNAPSDAQAGVVFQGKLDIAAGTATATYTAGKLSRNVVATPSASATTAYLTDDNSGVGVAPTSLGIVSGHASGATPLVVTKTLALRNPATSALALPSNLNFAIGPAPTNGAVETIQIATSTTNGCAAAAVAGSIAAGQSCLLTVTWTFPSTTAAAAGPRLFTASVLAGTSTLYSMNLIGAVGSAASFSVSNNSLDFGDVSTASGATSQTETLTITNVGELTSAVPAIGSDDTSIHTSGCTTTLAPGASCTLSVTIAPQNTGASGNKHITLSGSDIATVTWFGTVAASLSAGTTQYTFADQAVLSTTLDYKVFTITNGTNSATSGALSFAVVDASGNVVPDFQIMANGANLGAPAGTSTPVFADSTCLTVSELLRPALTANCTVTVAFVPTALTTAAIQGTFTVTSANAPKVQVAVQGTPIAPITVTGATNSTLNADKTVATISGTPSVAAHDTVSVTVTFTNEAKAPTTGLLTAVLTSTNDLSSFVVADDQCSGKTIAGGAACTVQVTFAPKSIGAKTAKLTLSGTPGNSVAVTLTGTPST